MVVLVTVPLGKPLCELLLRWWNRNVDPRHRRWMSVTPTISWVAAWSGGALGVYSHLLLDALMHWDARPLAPVSDANPFVGGLSVGQINLLCLACLLAGGALVGGRAVLSHRNARSSSPQAGRSKETT